MTTCAVIFNCLRELVARLQILDCSNQVGKIGRASFPD